MMLGKIEACVTLLPLINLHAHLSSGINSATITSEGGTPSQARILHLPEVREPCNGCEEDVHERGVGLHAKWLI